MIAVLPVHTAMPRNPEEPVDVPPHAQRKEARLELRIEPALADRAQRRAERLGLTRSSLARMALIYYLDRLDDADASKRPAKE